MDFTFEVKVLKIASAKRQLLSEAEGLLKEERIKLDVEAVFELDYCATPSNRSHAADTLKLYRDQLAVEKQFYTEFHAAYLREINEIATELNLDDREKFLARSIPGLEVNQQLRLAINHEKNNAVEKTLELIELIESHSEAFHFSDSIKIADDSLYCQFEQVTNEIDQSLENQYSLAMKQRERGREGQGVMETFLNILKNN